RLGCASVPTIPKPSPRSRSAFSPTTSWAALSSPKPTSTCAASTGQTSPSRRRASTPTWSARPARLSARPRSVLRPELADPGVARVPAHAGEQLVGRHLQRTHQLDQGVDAGEPQAALQLADLGAVQRGSHAQLVL